MPRLVDVNERSAHLTSAVLSLAARGGVAAVTLRAVAQWAGLTLAEVRYARPTRDRLIHLAVASTALRRARRRRHVYLRTADRAVQLAECWLPESTGDELEIEREKGWQAFRMVCPHLPPATAAFLVDDDTELEELCVDVTGSASAAFLLAATVRGLSEAVVAGSLDLRDARALLAAALPAPARVPPIPVSWQGRLDPPAEE